MDLLSLGYTQWDGCVVDFPCGNRFSTSQSNCATNYRHLNVPGGTAQPIVLYLQTVSFVNKIPVLS